MFCGFPWKLKEVCLWTYSRSNFDYTNTLPSFREETGTTLRQKRNAMKSVFIQRTKKYLYFSLSIHLFEILRMLHNINWWRNQIWCWVVFVFLSISSSRLAIYQWCQDLAKAHISTMVTTVSEGSVNNSSTEAASVRFWPRSIPSIVNFFFRK